MTHEERAIVARWMEHVEHILRALSALEAFPLATGTQLEALTQLRADLAALPLSGGSSLTTAQRRALMMITPYGPPERAWDAATAPDRTATIPPEMIHELLESLPQVRDQWGKGE